eukprot:gb/GECG01011387.1/.p1 GENE.gb/GECG01011387.1/~~gb/GECG01011387.1/.p1  ORF type:complete len:364 (+),score=87.88 gb/GECG01011387.1/:1-1092(+)
MSSSSQQANSASSTQIRRDDLVLDSRAREAVDRVADDYWQKRAQQDGNEDALKELEENGGENSMLSQMMNAALGARKEEEEKQDREQQERVKSKSFGEGLFRKGFLKKKRKNGQSLFGSGKDKSSCSSTTANRQVTTASQSSSNGTNNSTSDDIPYISKPKKDDSTDESLRFPEVQEAMREKLGDQKWMNEDLLKKISADHRIARGLQDPRCQQAIEDMQKDPTNAKEKYKDDPQVTEFLQAFTGLLGEHFKQMGEKEGEQGQGKSEGQAQEDTENFDDVMRQIDAEKLAEKAKRREVAQDDDDVRNVLSDPQVVSLLTDPNMQRILEESRNDPSKFSQYLRDPDTRAKLMTLQKAGLIRIEQ